MTSKSANANTGGLEPAHRNAAGGGPVDLQRLVQVARLHFVERVAQRDIGRMLGVSASTVSRLVQQAIDRGIVRFEVIDPTDPTAHEELGTRVARVLGIAGCVVAPTAAHRAATAMSVARAASQILLEHMRVGITLGVSGGRMAREVTDRLDPSLLQLGPASVQVVQLMGGIAPIASRVQAHAVASDLAQRLRGAVYLTHAPAILDDTEALRGLLTNRTVKLTTDLYRALDLALIGLGSMAPDSPLLASGFLTDHEIRRLAALGAVGDVCGRFIDAEGHICDRELDARTLAIPLTDLASRPTSIAVAFGSDKVPVIRAAAKASLVTLLITDEATASALAS